MKRFLTINESALLSGMSVRRLLQLGMREELSVYALDDWFWCLMEKPYQRWNVRIPIYLNDTTQIAMLERGGTFQLHVDSDGRFISRRDCDDNEYLDGVVVSEENLYCMKSEIEAMLNNKPVSKPKIKEHEKRNNDYIAYLKKTIPHIDDKPEPHTFDFRRKFLQDELIKIYGKKWLYDFDKWNKQRPFKDIVKLKRGR
jgi:hypothetical protein